MSYIMLSELPGELEARHLTGKMFLDGGATLSTENPHVGPQSDRLPHRSILICRSGALPRTGLGHNPRGARANQAHASVLSGAPRGISLCLKGNAADVAEATWDAAERED